MNYKINIIEDGRLITSYKSPIIPKHFDTINLLQGEFKVERLGHLVFSNNGENALSELDVFVSSN